MKKTNNLIHKGIVVSNKMSKTIIVRVDKKTKHKKYKKFIKCSTKYFVHCSDELIKLGDVVLFKEVAPISKKKNWLLISKS